MPEWSLIGDRSEKSNSDITTKNTAQFREISLAFRLRRDASPSKQSSPLDLIGIPVAYLHSLTEEFILLMSNFVFADQSRVSHFNNTLYESQFYTYRAYSLMEALQRVCLSAPAYYEKSERSAEAQEIERTAQLHFIKQIGKSLSMIYLFSDTKKPFFANSFLEGTRRSLEQSSLKALVKLISQSSVFDDASDSVIKAVAEISEEYPQLVDKSAKLVLTILRTDHDNWVPNMVKKLLLHGPILERLLSLCNPTVSLECKGYLEGLDQRYRIGLIAFLKSVDSQRLDKIDILDLVALVKSEHKAQLKNGSIPSSVGMKAYQGNEFRHARTGSNSASRAPSTHVDAFVLASHDMQRIGSQ